MMPRAEENGNEDKVRLGISTCLLGRSVRYDGGHKLNRFLRDTLGQFVEWVPVCPEVECGLTVPRESMRLAGDVENPRLITFKTKIDHTERMKSWANHRLEKIEKEELCGFVFKSKSPSSGMERINVYGDDGKVRKAGRGIWAKMFMEKFPLLPVEDEGRLYDPDIRENFIERIFVFHRWRRLLKSGRKMGNLVDFHTRHKLLILAHHPETYRELGKLVAEGKSLDPEALFSSYESKLFTGLTHRATKKRNINVLHHLLGFFKKQLTADEKQELLDIIENYRKELIPLIVPITLINHYVRKYNQPYLKGQYYLTPHPYELKLRNHV